MSINAISAGDNTNNQSAVAARASANSAAVNNAAADTGLSTDASTAPASAKVTLSDLALQLGSSPTSSVKVALDALSPVQPQSKVKKKPKLMTLLDVDAFRVMRAKIDASLRGQKTPNLTDVVTTSDEKLEKTK